MDVLPLLERCIAIERGVGEIYERIAVRFAEDREVRDFWLGLGADERDHAHKLSVWRSLLERQPDARHPDAAGFEPALLELEKLVRESRKEVERVHSLDDAFAIALALEASELDLIYTTLLQSSPIKRFPDIEETRRHELGRHHEALVREIRTRSKNEKNLYEAELLAARS